MLHEVDPSELSTVHITTRSIKETFDQVFSRCDGRLHAGHDMKQPFPDADNLILGNFGLARWQGLCTRRFGDDACKPPSDLSVLMRWTKRQERRISCYLLTVATRLKLLCFVPLRLPCNLERLTSA